MKHLLKFALALLLIVPSFGADMGVTVRNWNSAHREEWLNRFPGFPTVPFSRIEVWFNDPATATASEDTEYVVEIQVGNETFANKVTRKAGDVMDSVTTFYVEAPDKVAWTIYTPARSGVSQ